MEMKYTYPSTLGDVVSEYIWLWGSISKTLGGVYEQTNTDRSYNFIIVERKKIEKIHKNNQYVNEFDISDIKQ